MIKRITPILLLLGVAVSCDKATIKSPLRDMSMELTCESDTLRYTLSMADRVVVERAPLLLSVDDELIGWSIVSKDKSSQNLLFEMITGEQRQLSFDYNEVEYQLSGHTAGGREVEATLYARMYDGTFAYRFVLEAESPYLLAERSPYSFADKSGGYIVSNGENEPIGALPLEEMTKPSYIAPIIYQTKDMVVGLHEADLHNYPNLRVSRDTISRDFYISTDRALIEQDSVALAWRVVMCGESIADLHNSKKVYLSLAKSPDGDFSWVKPGLSTWDWRVKGTTFGGRRYEMTTKSLMRYIDFCSRSGIEYFLLDAEWYDDAHPIEPVEGLDIEAVIRYGEDKRVGVLLYYDLKYVKVTGYEIPFEAVATQFAKWGAKGLKYGFLGVPSIGDKLSAQGKVARTEELIRIAANSRLLIDFHDGPIPFGGLEREYPNYINREFCHAQMDRRWAFTPGQFVKMACINMLAGPIDQTNGTYALNTIKDRSKGPKNVYNSTVASETARFMITHTGNLSVLIDAPEAYDEKRDLFDYIVQMPERWDETRYLQMEFESHVTVAKRDCERWFISTVYNEKGGEHALPLDMLEEGETYLATIYRDGDDADFKTNKESYAVEHMELTSRDTIKMNVIPGGGYSVLLTKN